MKSIHPDLFKLSHPWRKLLNDFHVSWEAGDPFPGKRNPLSAERAAKSLAWLQEGTQPGQALQAEGACTTCDPPTKCIPRHKKLFLVFHGCKNGREFVKHLATLSTKLEEHCLEKTVLCNSIFETKFKPPLALKLTGEGCQLPWQVFAVNNSCLPTSQNRTLEPYSRDKVPWRWKEEGEHAPLQECQPRRLLPWCGSLPPSELESACSPGELCSCQQLRETSKQKEEAGGRGKTEWRSRQQRLLLSNFVPVEQPRPSLVSRQDKARFHGSSLDLLSLWPRLGSSPINSMTEKQSQGPAADCPVCWNPYDNTFRTPKVLQCQHSFCIECLAHLSLVSIVRNRLQCPLCRHPTVLPSDQTVTELPTNDTVLRLLRLEPNHIILEGRQLCLKEQRKSRYCLRQPRVYTLNLGPETDSSTASRQDLTPVGGSTTTTTTLSNRSALWNCIRDPQFRIFTYLMAIILSVTLLLIFSIFWNRQNFWGMG